MLSEAHTRSEALTHTQTQAQTQAQLTELKVFKFYNFKMHSFTYPLCLFAYLLVHTGTAISASSQLAKCAVVVVVATQFPFLSFISIFHSPLSLAVSLVMGSFSFHCTLFAMHSGKRTEELKCYCRSDYHHCHQHQPPPPPPH